MTAPPGVELADQLADDVEEIVIGTLVVLRRTADERKPTDPLPFTIVTHVAGAENPDEGTAAPVVSVHTLTQKSLGKVNLKNEARLTHRRMLWLGKSCPTITLADGRLVSVDYVDVLESPIVVPYGDDLILRKVGRYEVGLTYVSA